MQSHSADRRQTEVRTKCVPKLDKLQRGVRAAAGVLARIFASTYSTGLAVRHWNIDLDQLLLERPPK